jgi:hypothetical protein
MMRDTSPRILDHSTLIAMLTSKSLPYINLENMISTRSKQRKEMTRPPINKPRTRNDRNLTPSSPKNIQCVAMHLMTQNKKGKFPYLLSPNPKSKKIGLLGCMLVHFIGCQKTKFGQL